MEDTESVGLGARLYINPKSTNVNKFPYMYCVL
jgi:hypothetical protein